MHEPAGNARASNDLPAPQYLSAEYVLDEMGQHGMARVLTRSVPQILILSVMAGALITSGALFSVLVASGVETSGVERILEGAAFSAGFFFVILTGAALFTEANVVMPATLLSNHTRTVVWRVARFWALAWLGNFAGAVLIGWLIFVAQEYGAADEALLAEIIERKLEYRELGGVDAWWRIVLSGVLANWLVGLAAFFATMGRTIMGKYIPVLLAVTLFVSANFQHSPANMGYFALIMPGGEGPGWLVALGWNIIPAGIGNLLGGSLLVVLPLSFALRSRHPEAGGDEDRS